MIAQSSFVPSVMAWNAARSGASVFVVMPTVCAPRDRGATSV
jgi:hypothetical protein